MQTDTRERTDTYKHVTRMYLLNLHIPTPSNQPRLRINWIMSGMKEIIISKSAMAKFIMKTFVTDCLIFLSIKITVMTKELPTIPKTPIKINKMLRMIIVPRATGGSAESPGELNIPVTFSMLLLLLVVSVQL